MEGGKKERRGHRGSGQMEIGIFRAEGGILVKGRRERERGEREGASERERGEEGGLNDRENRAQWFRTVLN